MLTMKQSIFKRIFLLYGVILVLATVLVEVYITAAVRDSSIALRRESLAVQAGILAGEVPWTASAPLDAFCEDLKQLTGARVTVIAPDGAVRGDSDKKASLLDNHADRPEVRDALRTGVGAAIRRSESLNIDFLYLARAVAPAGRTTGIIRLSVPLADVDRTVNRLRVKLSLVVGGILGATGIFSIWQIGLLRRLTRRIRDFSAAIARGDTGAKLYLDAPGEFDETAASLNAMSAELRKLLAESEAEKNRLAAILRSIPDALLIIDTGGTVRIASAAARSFFGETPVQGRALIEIARNHELLTLIEAVRGCGESRIAEVRLNDPVERHVVVHASPLRAADGGFAGLIALFHDITRLKRLEQVRSDFVANISHELKTPITAITGFAETLLDGALHDRDHARKFIETIRSNSGRINALVDDLMTISQIELGVITVEKKPTDLLESIEAVLNLLRGQAEAKGLTVALSLPPSLRTVRADRDRLIQILTNLVQNAIKFTDSGGVTIGLHEEEGATVLTVQDTGVGVPAKHLPRLGERFYRVDPARSRTMGGTGLGLAIVKHLVKAHGWEMRIQSTPGSGTRVSIVMQDRQADAHCAS